MGRDILIDAFISLSKTLSFSATAQELGITQQAVSKNIARLEEQLGFPVLSRNAHKVSLTDWGRQFLELNEFYTQNLAVIRDRFCAESNIVKLEILGHPEFEFLKQIPPLYLSHPGMEVTIQTETARPDAAILNLLEGRTDLVVTLDRFMIEDEALVSYPVYCSEICLQVSKNHPLYHENVDYRAFRKEPFIAGTSFDKLFGASHAFIRKDIALLNLEPEIIIMKSSVTEATQSAINGEGILMGTSFLPPDVQTDLAAIPTGHFTKVLCVYKKSTKKYYLKKVAEYLEQVFADQYGKSEMIQ